MTTTDTRHNLFPAPYRAPGPREQIVRHREESELDWSGDRDGRRYQRAIDGWMAGRIRKASRHWRS
jgi:hypothetical protein